jgi:hypothetical protein
MNAPVKKTSALVSVLVVVGSLLAAAVGVGVTMSACSEGTSTAIPDGAATLPGCFAPEACWSKTCACLRAATPTECKTCDPLTMNTVNAACDCSGPRPDGAVTSQAADGFIYTVDSGASECLELVDVCVGRGAVCPGLGARCLPAGSSCASSSPTFDPPQLVTMTVGAGDAGVPTLVPRCPYVDDVCCAGTIPDAAVPDASAIPDGGVDAL